MTAAVRAEQVGVRLGRSQVLDHVDLEVAEGELVALLGPSGCGKTTLLRVLAGLQRADEGTVWLAGRDVTALPARRREIGFVFQSYGLFPTMTAQANVEFPLRVKGRRAPGERARELLGLMGMADLGGRRPVELSGGQQQRVALARALAREPEVLLLDEPLSALDAVIRDSLRDEIRALQQRLGLAVVHVTHDQAEALAMADRVAVMSHGAIVEVGPPRQIYDRPRSVFTARFVGGRNEVALSPGAGGTLGWGAGLVVADTGADVVAALFPPEAVSVESAGLGEPATVVLSSFQGATVRLHLEAAGTTIIAERPAADAARFPPGAACTVTVDPSAITAVPRSEALR